MKQKSVTFLYILNKFPVKGIMKEIPFIIAKEKQSKNLGINLT
jgi:hypothetical protein